jgi:hypothetical protein
VDLLIDPAYVEPPLQLDQGTYAAYMHQLADLVRFAETGLMQSVSTMTDVLTIYCRLCEGKYDALALKGPDGRQLFSQRDVRQLFDRLVSKSVWVEDRTGVQEIDRLTVSSFGKRDPEIDLLYRPGTIEKSRDRLLAASAIGRRTGAARPPIDSCLVPAIGLLDKQFTFSFRVRDDGLSSHSQRSFNVKGRAWLASSLECVVQHSGLGQLWIGAAGDAKRRYLVEQAIEIYRHTHVGRTNLPHWDFLHASFARSASTAGVMRDPGRAEAVLESIAETVCNDLNQRKHHAWRISVAGDAPQQTDGEYRAWRRQCGNGLWLKWWETDGDILIAMVSGHDDFSPLPPVGSQARQPGDDTRTSGLPHPPRRSSWRRLQ